MKEKERSIVSALVALFLVFWLGFLFHRSPRFAGSFRGGLLAVTGSCLMLVPLAYSIVKRIAPLSRGVTRYVSMQTFLVVHIYAGVIGPILVLLHTGHKFESPLGIALTAMTLIIVVSGFVGRYLLRSVGGEIQEKQRWLAELTAAFVRTQKEIQENPPAARELASLHGFAGRFVARLLVTYDGAPEATLPLAARALGLAESMADVEYAIASHEALKQAFSVWVSVHIVLSFVLYTLLGLHVWAGIHFGIRWFS